MAYQQQWSSANPGYVLILVDQSESMEDPFGGQAQTERASKAELVASMINAVLDDYLRINAAGSTYRDRAYFSVLGYAGTRVESALPEALQQLDCVTLSQLAASPRRQEVREVTRRGRNGEPITVRSTGNIWIDPVAKGPTPMCAAARLATELATKFVRAHPHSYPPVVINITDGLATDGDLEKAVRPLHDVESADGKALLFNCHITKQQLPAAEFPKEEGAVPNRPEARTMFWLSSRIPATARTAFGRATGRVLEEGTRGYIFNGDALSVRKMLTFGTTSADQPDLH